MKTLILFAILATMTGVTGFGQGVEKCDAAVLTVTSKKLGQLTQNEIRDFLLTFGKNCRNNAEF